MAQTSLLTYLSPQAQAEARLYRLKQKAKRGKPAPDHYEQWLRALYPSSVSAGFADHHHEFWQYIHSMERGVRLPPFVLLLARGGGKSTNCELATTYVAAKEKRRYGWYVRETQDQADKSVENVAALMESETAAEYYPKLAEREVGKYGNSKGWRRNRLRSKLFTLDAVGLDGGVRGARVEDDRPDFIIFDDIDGKHDTLKTIQKKVDTITTSILPAGSNDCCVVFVQNVIHKHGIAAQLCGIADKSADFLADRIVSGPHPAVIDLKLEAEQLLDGRIIHRVVGGTPTWEGQPLSVVEHQINTWGLSAFKQEAQHEVGDHEDALWNREILDLTRVIGMPDHLSRLCIAVDPHATTGQTGVVAVGSGVVNGNLHGYAVGDRSPPYGVKSDVWGFEVLCAYLDFEADSIVAEINNGGDMVANTIQQVKVVMGADGERRPMNAVQDVIVDDLENYTGSGIPVKLLLDGARVHIEVVRATRGKEVRAQPVATVFSQGRGHVVGYLPELEGELRSWVPGMDSPNRLDAMVWGFTYLGLSEELITNGVVIYDDYQEISPY